MTDPKVPPYSLRDEVDLLWYFGPGQKIFGWSTMGGMLARAESLKVEGYAWPTVPVMSGDVVIGRECGVTAWPTAETREVTGYMPDHEAMANGASLNRRFIRVIQADPVSAQVLANLFGDLGSRWASGEHGMGRIGSLFLLTEKGQALVDEAAKVPGALAVSAQTRIENIALADKVQPKPARTLALAVCARQAAKLEERARAVWHRVKST